MEIKQNISLKEYNTFGINSKASEFIEINSKSEAIDFIKSNNLKDKAHLILGGGSNILLTKDYDGLVLKNNIKGIAEEEGESSIKLNVGAGEDWHQFVKYCIENSYAGIENLSLIPGCVGASPMQNIGAYGVEVKDVITQVTAIDIETGEERVFSNQECEFGYRTSIFKTSLKGKYFITSVQFQLSKTPDFKVSYGDIKKQLAKNGVEEDDLSIKAVSDAVIAIRERKLPNPKEIGNSGSFFKNPIITKAEFDELKIVHKDMPAYELPQGGYKVAAGWLIERAGWKGYTDGNYGVHKNQALVLVNYGDASGIMIYNLSERIVRDIRRRFGIELEREVNII